MTCVPLLFAVTLCGGALSVQITDDRPQPWELLRILTEQPWSNTNRWDRLPRLSQQLGSKFPRQRYTGGENDMSWNDEDDSSVYSDKRSAVATALNAGRRRRQPAPLGKADTSYVGVGVLNDLDFFLDTLRDNIGTFATPERTDSFKDRPNVVPAPSAGGGGAGGGTGMRRFHALHPLRPTSNIRSYNRRSDIQTRASYPAANYHDPGLLWAGLGR